MYAKRATLLRTVIVGVLIAALEILCRTGAIDRFTIIPPSEMMAALLSMVRNGDWFWPDLAYTARNLVAAAVSSILLGYAVGVAIHAVPRLRRALEPLLLSYYSVPTFVFYPLLIVFFGVGPLSLIALGTVFSIVAMVVSTLTAIDRIPRGFLKVARVSRLTPYQAVMYVKLPAVLPHLFTGIKLAVIYSIVGVLAGEFIVSTAGVGRRIAYAYNDFDNQTMYGMLLLVLSVVAAVNAALHCVERRIHQRWSRHT